MHGPRITSLRLIPAGELLENVESRREVVRGGGGAREVELVILCRVARDAEHPPEHAVVASVVGAEGENVEVADVPRQGREDRRDMTEHRSEAN